MNNKRLIFLAVVAAAAIWYFFFRDADSSAAPRGVALTPKPAVSNAVNGVVPSTASNGILQRAGANKTAAQGNGSGNGFDGTGILKAGAGIVTSVWNSVFNRTYEEGPITRGGDIGIGTPQDADEGTGEGGSIGLPVYVDQGPGYWGGGAGDQGPPLSGMGPADVTYNDLGLPSIDP